MKGLPLYEFDPSLKIIACPPKDKMTYYLEGSLAILENKQAWRKWYGIYNIQWDPSWDFHALMSNVININAWKLRLPRSFKWTASVVKTGQMGSNSSWTFYVTYLIPNEKAIASTGSIKK